MSKKVEELLKVLDLPEEEQYEWLYKEFKYKVFRLKRKKYPNEFRCLFLADLAFRLRDETIANDDKSEIDCWWCEASYVVFLHEIGEENEMEAEGLDTWFSMRARPIHWIVASLIAKGLSK